MTNRVLILCLLISCILFSYTECRGGGGRSSGGSRSSSGGRSSSSWGKSWGWSRSSSSYNKPKYSSTSGSHTYPSSGSGLSGTGSGSHSYPSSTGLSGHGSPSGSHKYPSSNGGLSGTGSGTYNHASYGKNNNRPSYGTSYHPSSYNQRYNTQRYTPSYYTAPQYVYIHEYRQSDSRFGDLLTGLTLYNMGRSNSYHHDHYYYDDYYQRRYAPISSSDRPAEEAKCLLKVKENDKVEVLKIPCEIVSTFTEGSKKLAPTSETLVNKTVCVTNSTMMNSTVPVNGSSVNSTTTTHATMVNVTTCTTNSTTVLDPLSIKGPPANAKKMECVVEIHTKDALIRNNIDCNTLVSYAKMPEPKKHTGMLPPREKLKSWLSNPPWWLSLFIAV